MAVALQAHELVKNYGEIRALSGISFEVFEGEGFGFLGPNGAGKTTTIRLFTGLSRPSQGAARVMSLDVTRQATTVKRLVGVVPEVSNLYDELSCYHNLVFVGQLYGLPTRCARQRAGELLEAFGLGDRSDTPFRTLSRGLKRRLTIAAALVHHPRVLFLDEPTAGLDVIAARQLREIVKRLRTEGVTVFLTTHNLEEAAELADRVAIIVRGRIVALETPDRMRAAEASETKLELSLEGPRDNLIQRLAALTGVTDVREIPAGVVFKVTDLGQVLGQVASCLQQTGTRLTAVNTVRPTLEDAFLRLSRDPQTME